MKYTENKLRQIFARSVQMFNQNMDEHYSVDDGGIMLRFFTPENGANVYEDFCRTYFPDYLKENYKPRKR